METKTRLADISLIGVALLWGAGFAAVQTAMDSGMPISLLLALRFILGALLIFAIKAKTILSITRSELKVGVTAGVLLFLAYFFQTVGQARSGISNAAFITAVYVVLVPFIAWAALHKRPQTKMFFLVFLTLAGVMILTYVPGVPVFSMDLGNFMLLLCAVGFACHLVYLGAKSGGIDSFKFTFMQLATCAVLGIVFYLSKDLKNTVDVNWAQGLSSVAYLGVFSTAVCFFIQTWAQGITTPSKAAIMMSSESVFGALFSILFGFEIFRIQMPIGGAIIMACVVLSEVSLRKKAPLEA